MRASQEATAFLSDKTTRSAKSIQRTGESLLRKAKRLQRKTTDLFVDGGRKLGSQAMQKVGH